MARLDGTEPIGLFDSRYLNLSGDLGDQKKIQWDLTPGTLTPTEGLMYWNSDDGTLNLGMPGGNVNLQIGQEGLLRVRNEEFKKLLDFLNFLRAVRSEFKKCLELSEG